MNPAEAIDRVFAIFAAHGGRSYGENVTELEHALQTAAFAQMHDEPDSLVAACLLHDLGHMLHHHGEDAADRGLDMRHEDLGAAVLGRWFADDVVEPARLHVAAKRYLCAVDARYRDGLSAASAKSLALQGGPMSPAEVAAFENHPHGRAAVKLRRYDDMGKVPGMTTAALESYRPLLERLVRSGAQP